MFHSSFYKSAISIHAPRGGSDELVGFLQARFCISIHAPRGGSDVSTETRLTRHQNFNPRSPWGERLNCTVSDGHDVNFNPRSPWGERPWRRSSQYTEIQFQSTLPVGGATCGSMVSFPNTRISIHAPRGGSDLGFRSIRFSWFNFNPRSPWGERRTDSASQLKPP